MNRPRPPFLGWPGWRLLGEAVLLGTVQTLWWLAIYGGADWLTSIRTDRVHVHLDLELKIPSISAFILIYRSIDAMFLLAPFILRSRRELLALTMALAMVTAAAGIGFVLLPAELAYAPQDHGAWEPFYRWNERIVLTFNLVPSLHVALSVVTLSAYGLGRGKLGRGLLAGWAAAIALSTLLTHQHHLLDVVTGLMLGALGHSLVYRRYLLRGQSQAAQISPASPSSDPAPPA